MARVKWNRAAPKEIMKSSEMESKMGDEVSKIAARLNPEDYGSIVEDGGDRVRGAAWTKSVRGMRRTARDSELLRALGGS